MDLLMSSVLLCFIEEETWKHRIEAVASAAAEEEELIVSLEKWILCTVFSRNGTVEHPHLLRVHHHRNNGKYKSGYVWQDLKDEISSLQFQTTKGFPSDQSEMTVKTARGPAERAAAELHQVAPELKPEQPETLHIEPLPQLDRDSLVKPDHRSVDDMDRRMAVFRVDAATARKQQDEEKQRFRRSYSSRASHVFRNILTCGAADANEAVLMPARRAGSGGPRRRRSTSDVPPRQQPSQQQDSQGDNSRKSRKGTTGYKPLGAPNCSQCGRQFDPEKFQAHMQSCRGLRGSRRRGRPSVDRVPLRRESRSEEDFSTESISGYLN